MDFERAGTSDPQLVSGLHEAPHVKDILRSVPSTPETMDQWTGPVSSSGQFGAALGQFCVPLSPVLFRIFSRVALLIPRFEELSDQSSDPRPHTPTTADISGCTATWHPGASSSPL